MKTDRYDLIVRFLDGEASEEEKKELLNWIKQKKNNIRIFCEVKDIWDVTNRSENKKGKAEEAWNKFEKYVNPKQEKASHLQILKQDRKFILRIITKYAAAVIILIGISLAAINIFKAKEPVFTVTRIPLGEKGQIQLFDGTKVWLNSGSEVKFSSDFGKKERVVYLEGEALFEVTKGKSAPFIVNTSDISVKVYGTIFNVKSYPEDDIIETILVEGSLGIRKTKDNLDKELKIAPNQKLTYIKSNNELRVSHVDVNVYTAWKNNELIFNDENFENVIKSLERWYNVKVIYDISDFIDVRLTAKFINQENLVDVMEVIKITSRFNCRVSDNGVIITKI